MVAIESASVRNSAASGLGAGLTRRRLFWIVLVVSALAYAQTEFWKQASAGDRAAWDYFAQIISRGGVRSSRISCPAIRYSFTEMRRYWCYPA